jgi:hypothetical protein
MFGIGRNLVCILGCLGVVAAAPAGAQESLDSGKTPAQLFASDCAICHKSPQGLVKSGGILGLDNFLREHYTASRESAAAIAAYLQSMGSGPAPAPGRATKRSAKGDDKTKGSEKKPELGTSGDTTFGDGLFGGAKSDDAKSGDKTPGERKPAQAKRSGTKSSDSKPADTKPSETKPSEAKPADAKPVEAKPVEAKPQELKPIESKPVQNPKLD